MKDWKFSVSNILVVLTLIAGTAAVILPHAVVYAATWKCAYCGTECSMNGRPNPGLCYRNGGGRSGHGWYLYRR